MMDLEVSRLKSLLRALALYGEARGRLLQIEAQEAGVKFTTMIVLASLAAGFLLCGWLLAVPAIVWLVSHTQGWLHCDIPGTDASGARNYCTAMAVLALTVEYRYLPIYQR